MQAKRVLDDVNFVVVRDLVDGVGIAQEFRLQVLDVIVERFVGTDRVGGGDGYASGFIYGLLSGESEQDAVNLGWAHGALLTTFPGDTSMATVEQVKAFAKGGSARIQR